MGLPANVFASSSRIRNDPTSLCFEIDATAPAAADDDDVVDVIPLKNSNKTRGLL